MNNNVYIVQPYLSMKGHYRQYFENLLFINYRYVYCDVADRYYKNSFFIKTYSKDCEKNFLKFILCRLINSYKVYQFLKQQIKDNDLIHLIEFEPFNFILFELSTYLKKKKIIITIHSIDSMHYQNKIKNFIALFQRIVYRFGLKLAKRKKYNFVVHYKIHKKQLQKIVGKDAIINVIEYPSPPIKIDKPKTLKSKRLLIFGQIREDKGFYEFLSQELSKKLFITIAGKIYDNRINSLKKHVSYKFIDKFIDDEELKKLFFEHDFLLLPYSKKYSGGAGPLKDSFAYGMPVITTNIPIFKEIIDTYRTGFYFNNIYELNTILKRISHKIYLDYSKNCIKYAYNHGWNYMRNEYFKLYKHLIDC